MTQSMFEDLLTIALIDCSKFYVWKRQIHVFSWFMLIEIPATNFNIC